MITPGLPVVDLTLFDPEPPVGTALHVGSAVPASGDRATFMRLAAGWHFAYGNDPWRPCTYELIRYWLPARITAGPLVSRQYTGRRPPSPWFVDLEEAG